MATEVLSEVTGTVWKVEMSVGDTVEEGDVIMIVESMKMEIPIEAPGSGTLSAVHVQPEQPIEEDQLLAEIS